MFVLASNFGDWLVVFIKRFYVFFLQVTEQLQASIESRMKEAEKNCQNLEEKLMKAVIEKQELEEQNKRAQVSFDEQVVVSNFHIFNRNYSIICFHYTIKKFALCRWTL